MENHTRHRPEFSGHHTENPDDGPVGKKRAHHRQGPAYVNSTTPPAAWNARRENWMSGSHARGKNTADQPLYDVLMDEVVPRLVKREAVAHGAPQQEAQSALGQEPVSDAPAIEAGPWAPQAAELARLAVQEGFDACARFVLELRRQGLSAEALHLELIRPAARHLGVAWCQDSCHFSEVTIGVGHLQRLLSESLDDLHRENRDHSPPARDFAPGQRSILLCTLPGCQHRLGMQMAGAFFAKDGWRTRIAHAADEASLLRDIAQTRPHLIGLSLGSEREIRRAGAFILRAREISRDFLPGIMVGGPAVSVFPVLAARLGADLISGEAPEAVRQANAMMKGRFGGTL
jgi:methanogenic corrinoid protein MtbC1